MHIRASRRGRKECLASFCLGSLGLARAIDARQAVMRPYGVIGEVVFDAEGARARE